MSNRTEQTFCVRLNNIWSNLLLNYNEGAFKLSYSNCLKFEVAKKGFKTMHFLLIQGSLANKSGISVARAQFSLSILFPFCILVPVNLGNFEKSNGFKNFRKRFKSGKSPGDNSCDFIRDEKIDGKSFISFFFCSCFLNFVILHLKQSRIIV